MTRDEYFKLKAENAAWYAQLWRDLAKREDWIYTPQECMKTASDFEALSKR